MVSFNKFFTSVFLAILYAGQNAVAVPFSPSVKFATHRTRELGSLTLETYNPVSTYETFGEGLDHPLSKRATEDLDSATVAFIESKLNIDASTIHYRTGYSADTVQHAYVRQSHDGVVFANAVANVAFSHDDKIVAFGSSFVTPTKIAPSTPAISVADATAKAEELLTGSSQGLIEPRVEYVALADGSAVLTNVIQVRNEEAQTWGEAFLDAQTNELVHMVDFVAQASYRVLPITKEYLTEGFETLTDPQNLVSSPWGWHSVDGTTQTTTTSGNNVISFKGTTTTAVGTQSSATQNFVYVQDPAQAPTVAVNANAALTNNFYIINTLHDIFYLYGFTETAFNFQQSNRGLAGKGNDRVTASVPSTSGTNNANFATPADGSSGHMNMYLWTLTSPQRDGSLENDIVAHELTHGLSNRLTGGGTGACLQSTEAGGMGEGWSDAVADWVTQKASPVVDFTLGVYVDLQNIRTHAYSTSATTNPLRYSSVATLNEVHNIGEVWANILHNVLAALTVAHGFSATAKTDPTSTSGTAVYLHLLIDGLALQPCAPTFVTARDAIIQADVNRYAGANKCTLWKAFASKGVGFGAVSGRYVDSTTLPTGC